MSDEIPSKAEILQIFKRLKSISANKVCFDCNAKNPTWSSVTYGVLICMDCSAVHRSLGVHVSFVRSTQLDTNWTWIQLRHMQLGGNANAESFFNQHNCRTTDAQQKYNSRAAQLYREKLHSLAVQAMRVHGTTLHVGGSSVPSESQSPDPSDKKPVDFFEEHTAKNGDEPEDEESEEVFFGHRQVEQKKSDPGEEIGETAGPNVDHILSTSPSKVAPMPIKKSTIGARKPAAKKTGLGGKKGGLGATKVRTDFAEVQKEAELADQILYESKNKPSSAFEEKTKISPEESAQAESEKLASMKLAYEALSAGQEQARSTMDPKKAEQAERLGMGFGVGMGSGGMSHSVFSEMKAIEQERPGGYGKGSSKKKVMTKKDFFASGDDSDDSDNGRRDDDFGFGSSKKSSYGKSATTTSSSSFFDEQLGGGDLFESGKKGPSKPSWEKDLEARTGAMKLSSGYTDSSSSGRAGASSGVGLGAGFNTEDQLKKFANAKSISSDQFFGGREQSYEERMNLSRFEGSTAISSDAYFGRETAGGAGGSGGGRLSSVVTAAPDLDDVKESVRQGVTKVAGKLSNLATGVMQQIQDRYGY